MWSLLSPGAPIANPAPQAIDVAQDLENTVLAATDQEPAPESLR
jgi:hypothetical protein